MNQNPNEPADDDAFDPEAAAPLDAAAADVERAHFEAQIADLKDRLIRTLADMENLRRRTEREIQDSRRYAVSAFARDIVGVADNLRRAFDAQNEEGASPEALFAGVELTERELLNVLERHGVRKIVADGVKFDPNLHQAVFEIPDPSAPHGSVVRVMQDGYMIGERVLRPAMVAIAKGGPKFAAAETRDDVDHDEAADERR